MADVSGITTQPIEQPKVQFVDAPMGSAEAIAAQQGAIQQQKFEQQQAQQQQPMKLGEGEGAYKIVKGIDASGNTIEAPSYMFPYQTVSGMPTMGEFGGATFARNVETGGYFRRPAGEPEKFGEAIALASKYKSDIAQIAREATSAQQARDVAHEQAVAREQSELKSGMLLSGTAKWGSIADYGTKFQEQFGRAPTLLEQERVITPQTSEQLALKAQMLTSPDAKFGDIGFASAEAQKLAQLSGSTISPIGTEIFEFKPPESISVVSPETIGVESKLVDIKPIKEEQMSPYPGMSQKDFQDFVFGRERTLGVDKSGKPIDIVSFHTKISGKGIVNDQNEIMLTTKESKLYNDILAEGSNIKSEQDKIEYRQYALRTAVGKEKFEKASEIIQKREFEKAYREAKEKSDISSALTPLTSADILGRTYGAMTERLIGSPEKAEQLRRELIVAGEARKSELGGMAERGEILPSFTEKEGFKSGLVLDVGLQSPVTAMIPVGVGFKVVGGVGKYALGKAALAAGEKTLFGRGALATAKYGEKVVGGAFLAQIGLDVASSKSVSEGVGKVAVLGAELPGAAFGYKMIPGKMPSIPKFEEASGIKSVREIIPEIAPSTRIGDIKAAGEVLGEIKTDIFTELRKPSLQEQKITAGREQIVEPLEKQISPITRTITETGKGIEKLGKEKVSEASEYVKGGIEELVSPIREAKKELKVIGKDIGEAGRLYTRDILTVDKKYIPDILKDITLEYSFGKPINKFSLEQQSLIRKSGISRAINARKSTYVEKRTFSEEYLKNREIERQKRIEDLTKITEQTPSEIVKRESQRVEHKESIKKIKEEELTKLRAEGRGFSLEQIAKAEKELSKPNIIVKKVTKTISEGGGISEFGASKMPEFVGGKFGKITGGKLFEAYPKKTGGLKKEISEPPKMVDIFSGIREEMGAKKEHFIDVTPTKSKVKDTSVIDNRKIKTKEKQKEPEVLKMDIPESFFVEETKILEQQKPKPKVEISEEVRKIEIRPKPKETYVEKEVKTSTGQVLILKQVLKPLELKPPKIELEIFKPLEEKVIQKQKIDLKTEQKPEIKIFPTGLFGIENIKQKQKIYQTTDQAQKEFLNTMISVKTITPIGITQKTPVRVAEKTSEKIITPLATPTLTPTLTSTATIQPTIIKTIQFPRPYLDTYWNEELQTEIPVDPIVIMGKDGEKVMEKRKKPKQTEHAYKYRFRASPIYSGAESLFATSPLKASVKPQDKAKPTKRIVSKPETFDLRLTKFVNPMEKTNKIIHTKKHKNVNKKQFWET